MGQNGRLKCALGFLLIYDFYSKRSEVYKFVAWRSCEDRLGQSNLDLPIFFPKVSAQLPSNKTKSRPLTVVHSPVSSFLACFAVYICVLTCLFVVCEQVTGPISDANKGHEQRQQHLI